MRKLEVKIKILEQELFATKLIDDDFPDFAIDAERQHLVNTLLKNATFEVISDELMEENN